MSGESHESIWMASDIEELAGAPQEDVDFLVSRLEEEGFSSFATETHSFLSVLGGNVPLVNEKADRLREGWRHLAFYDAHDSSHDSFLQNMERSGFKRDEAVEEQKQQRFDDSCADSLISSLQEACRAINGIQMARDEDLTSVSQTLLSNAKRRVNVALHAAELVKERTEAS